MIRGVFKMKYAATIAVEKIIVLRSCCFALCLRFLLLSPGLFRLLPSLTLSLRLITCSVTRPYIVATRINDIMYMLPHVIGITRGKPYRMEGNVTAAPNDSENNQMPTFTIFRFILDDEFR